jgi:hypothetical protein
VLVRLEAMLDVCCRLRHTRPRLGGIKRVRRDDPAHPNRVGRPINGRSWSKVAWILRILLSVITPNFGP